MKEIKFRVWNGFAMEYNIVAGKFGVFYVNPGVKNDGLDENDSASLTPFNTKYDAATPVMEFSGVKDTNGVDIYEGDIVNVNGKNREIVWRGAGFYCTWSDYALDTCWFTGGGPKVVGNIFENPELVK